MCRVSLTALLLLFMTMAASNSLAFNIWKNRATDDSVCELYPNIDARINQKVNIPAGTLQEAAIYTRMAVRIVAENCRNGQALILGTDAALPLDRDYFHEVVGRLCVAADVRNVPIASQEHPNALQLRCTLTKVDEAAAWLSKAEADKSTSAMIAEGAPKNQGPIGASADTSVQDCKTKKLTLGTLMFGGGKNCQ